MPHGEGHKRVGERQFVAPKKSDALIPTYENRCHVFCAFTDGKYEIPDMLFFVHMCKRQVNVQEETFTVSGTQRYLGGPLCANNYKLQKVVLWFAQAKLPDSLLQLHIPGWCHLYVAKSYVATKMN